VTNSTTTKKTKLCWNCEGVVDRSSENCIYCGVYLHPEKEELEEEYEEGEAKPHYTPQDHEGEEYEPHYQSEEDEKIIYEEIHAEETKKAATSEDIKGVILPLVFLLAGSIFMLFGLILYFFSKDGVFVLKWNANYWFIYLLIAVPLLFIGWRTLQYFEEGTSNP